MVVKRIKSRKHHIEIKVDETGHFVCPKQKQRPCMTVEMCLGRQAREYRGCRSCRIPQKIERKKEEK
jgi:hypothetical protein